jgi:hypothetical protein
MKYRIILIILSLFLVGCQPVSRNQNDQGMLNWSYGDLRQLDPIDAAKSDQDLIAIYTRFNNQSFQIRLDFLDLATYLGKDIYIPLDTNPGGNPQIKTDNNGSLVSDINWDYLIKITNSGNIEILDKQLSPISAELFIVYDSWQDRMVISFNKNILPIYFGLTKLQVIITPPNQNVISDKSEPFFVDSPPPPRAKVLFAFWNIFSSSTPAQTLRSWAGAHSGPISSRHGLSYLIDAAAQTKSTVFLLDLLTPDTLSALDYINAMPRIRILAEQGVLALPDVGNLEHLAGTSYISTPVTLYNPLEKSNLYKTWQISSNIKSNYIDDNSDFVLLLNKFIMLNREYINFSGIDYAKYAYYKNNCDLLPIFTDGGVIKRSLDLSLDCKSLWLSYAIAHPTTPLILGGDFANSILGDPTANSEVFSYINSHPWIQIISINDLTSSRELISSASLPYHGRTPASDANAQNTNLYSKSNTSKLQNNVYDALLQSPKNRLMDLAWQVFSHLTQPASPELAKLRANYIGQIGDILTAANWAENPLPQMTCNTDLDYDGASECILANDTIFAIIEPVGGYIQFVFTKDSEGIHQIIGPTWEFVVGLSDPSTWKPNLGVRGDSAQLLGAFQDSFENWNSYKVELQQNKLELFGDNKAIDKSITLLSNSLHIDILNPSQIPSTADIPLVIDPWFRYNSGWGEAYSTKKEQLNIQWGIKSGEIVEIRATNPLNIFSFNDTRVKMFYPEDPNYDYSSGHYLPYPMSVAEISTTKNYSIDIVISP